MARGTDVMKIRKLLLRRRRDILKTALAARHEAQALKEQERDPEYEENAQVELAHYTLSHLMEAQRKEILLIDAALQRIDAGVFGVCVDCGQPISMERLEVLPFAL
ncbi:MAG: TraR/DksA family transcriptional regulator, partial [Myxococcota bacterium]